MRKYAESLVGDLDRSYYGTQRDVANRTYQTNWENLQNQYKNLQEKLKTQQAQANRDFANGLVNVSEDSFGRMQNANENLANRGLTTSGTRDFYIQADTVQKGEDVSKLLGKSNNIALDIANKLSEANQKYADNQAELQGGLGEALGKIGDAETAAQMSYNEGLARIAGAAEDRKAANAAAARSLGGSDEDKELDEAMRRQAIMKVLKDETLTEDKKYAALRTVLDVEDARAVVDSMYQDVRKKEYSEQLEKQKKDQDKKSKEYNDAKNWGVTVTVGVSDKERNATVRDKKILYMYMSGDKSVSKLQADTAFDNLYKNGKMSKSEKEGYKNAMAALRGENSEKVPKYYKKKVNQLYEQYEGYANAEKKAEAKYNDSKTKMSDIEALYNKDYGEISELIYGR